MELRPLTKSEIEFAEQNHELVYAFMNEKGLPEDEYYDIVIFGYLRAVQEYCQNSLRYKCRFSTLAWPKMQGAVSNYHKGVSSSKRNAKIVSFDDDLGLFIQNNSFYDSYLTDLKTHLLMHELACRLPEKEMRIVKMKVHGYSLQDIARAEKMNFNQIGRLLESIYPTVIQIFYS